MYIVHNSLPSYLFTLGKGLHVYTGDVIKDIHYTHYIWYQNTGSNLSAYQKRDLKNYNVFML